ncbi:MAG: hypothetical protein KGM24_00850 [Elusimicrobia bacterium]|nr:hypothetical protein [Elusimicrobiota bacterium]
MTRGGAGVWRGGRGDFPNALIGFFFAPILAGIPALAGFFTALFRGQIAQPNALLWMVLSLGYVLLCSYSLTAVYGTSVGWLLTRLKIAGFVPSLIAGLIPTLVIAHLLRAHHAPHVRLLSAVALSSGPLVAAALWFLSRS